MGIAIKKWFGSFTGLSLALAGSLAAQQTPPVPPPNIVNIETVNIKPYMDEPYDKVASEYPGLSQQVKDPMHVLGMEALTGSPRAIYLSGFDSFESLQKNEEWLSGDAATDTKFDGLDARAAAYISDVHNTVRHYRPDLSNNVKGADIPHSHYWEMIVFDMRPGHAEHFQEVTKLYRDAYLKSGQNIPWSAYEGMLGVTDSYLVLVPMTARTEKVVAVWDLPTHTTPRITSAIPNKRNQPHDFLTCSRPAASTFITVVISFSLFTCCRYAVLAGSAARLSPISV